MSWNARDYDPDWPYEWKATSFTLDPSAAALLVIDVQAGLMCRDFDDELSGKYPSIAAYWYEEIKNRVVPNTKRLLDYFRERDMGVVFTRNGYLSSTGEESTKRLRPKQIPTRDHRGTARYEIDERLAPCEDELVMDKLTSGAFSASWLDHALRNMGITSLVITGILSDACVLGTARGAAELGYDTMICEDACATHTLRAHTEAMLMHARVFGRVAQAQDIIAELGGRDS